MSQIKFRAKIEKIEGDQLHYSLPSRVYPREIPDFGEHALADPLTLKTDYLEVENIFYLGNKNRLKEKFAKLVPEDVKTVFDPMCGGAMFLTELARSGKTIIANDYSTSPFYLARAIFLKNKPSLEMFDEFAKSVKEFEGYYFKKAKELFPILAGRKHTQRYIDGYILRAREVEYGHFYLGVMSGCMLSWFGAFGGPYLRWSYSTFKRNLRTYAKQLINFEVSGKVTNYDALKMDIPNVDMIYFDPPYSEKLFKYVSKFGKLNSILLQKDWVRNEITQEEVSKLTKKLAGHCKYLFVSTNAACPIHWRPLFEGTGRTASRKKFILTGSGAIASSMAGAQHNQRKMEEILWVSVRKSKEDETVEKAQKDPFMIYPDESETYEYMIHSHFRGKSSHLDLRIENLGKEFLIGWTLMAQRAGAIKEPVLTLSDARKIDADSEKFYKINLQTGEWATREKKGAKESVRIEIVAARKKVEPIEWAEFSGVTKPGAVGATSQYPGVFLIVDKGKAEYLSQKGGWLHEYWFDGKVLKNGRYFFRQLKAWSTKKSGDEPDQQEVLGSDGLWEHMKELNVQAVKVLKSNGMTDDQIQEWIEPQLIETMKEMDLSREEIEKAFVIPPGKEEGLGPEVGWLFINPDDQVPYVVSSRAIDQEFLPPTSMSALPRHWRVHVKDDEKYWIAQNKSAALERRKNLVERWKEEGMIGRAEKGDRNPFKEHVEKARHRLDQCMDCSKPPDLEIIWANGEGHAWFCWSCFIKWLGDDEANPWSGKGDDIQSAKLIKNGEASKKQADNTNPNIKEKLAEFIVSENAKGTVSEFKVFIDWLAVQKAVISEFKVFIDWLAVQKAVISEFRLTYQFWKGQKVIREGASKERFLFWIKDEEKYLIFRLNSNILSSEKTGAMLLTDNWGKEEYQTTDYVKPGTPLNPTKNTPSFIKLLDSGKAIILIDEPDLKKVQFDGKDLKGVFLFKKAEDHWFVERTGGGPGNNET